MLQETKGSSKLKQLLMQEAHSYRAGDSKAMFPGEFSIAQGIFPSAGGISNRKSPAQLEDFMQQLLGGIVEVCVMHRAVTEQNPLLHTHTPKKKRESDQSLPLWPQALGFKCHSAQVMAESSTGALRGPKLLWPCGCSHVLLPFPCSGMAWECPPQAPGQWE